jgi:hypothetical protein
MSLSVRSFMKLQWKWVSVTLLLYMVFYVFPLFIVGNIPASKVAVVFAGVWLFAGIAVIAAVAGFLSPGVTIWEPAIAGAALYTLALIADATMSIHMALLQNLAPPPVSLAVIFMLSLYGAIWGETAQKLWRNKSPR